jgi:transposase
MTRHRLQVTESDRRRLAAWVRAGTTPQRVTRRARIVLLAAEGRSVRAIAEALGVSERTVMLWRRRYEEHGADALRRDAPGRGRKPSLPREAASRVRALLATDPPEGGRWTIRRLAEATALSRASVHRIVRSLKV